MQSFALLLHAERARSDQATRPTKYSKALHRRLDAPHVGVIVAFARTKYRIMLKVFFNCALVSAVIGVAKWEKIAKKKMTCVTLIRALNRKFLRAAKMNYKTTEYSL